MRKVLSVLLVALFLMGSISAAAEVTITYNDWCAIDPAWEACYNDLFDKFHELYGDEIKVETYGTIASQTRQQLLMSASSGTNEDCAKIKTEWIKDFVDMGVLEELTPYLSEEMLNDYEEGVLKGYTFDGKLYAVSYFNQAYAMYYNKDLIEKAGITELPTTMPELVEAAYKVAALGHDDNGNKIYGLGLQNGANRAGEGVTWLPMMWGFGGEFLDEDGNVVLYSPENVEALTAIQNMMMDGVMPAGLPAEDMRQLFATGTLGFYPELLSQTTVFASGSELGKEYLNHIGVIPYPGQTGYSYESVLVIFKNSENKEACAKLLDYLSGIDGQQVLRDHNKGKTSDRKSVMETVYGDTSSLDDFTRTFVEAIYTSRTVPLSNPALAPTDLALTAAIHRLYAGEDVDTVLKELDAEVKGYYGQN